MKELEIPVKDETIARTCYTIEDIEVLLDISRRGVMRLIREKAFPFRMIGNRYRIPIKTFHEWLEGGE